MKFREMVADLDKGGSLALLDRPFYYLILEQSPQDFSLLDKVHGMYNGSG